MFRHVLIILIAGAIQVSAADKLVLSEKVRAMPGTNGPTPFLYFKNLMTTSNAVSTNAPIIATNVMISGSWAQWTNRLELTAQADDLWVLDTRPHDIPFGRHRYKFIVNGIWEQGADRELYANAESTLEVPSSLISDAYVQDFHTIEVFLDTAVTDSKGLAVTLDPDPGIEEWHLASAAELGRRQGYMMRGDQLTLLFDEKTYGLKLSETATVCVAGNFNWWNSNAKAPFALTDEDGDGVWESTLPLQALRTPPGEEHLLFKFVVNGDQWLLPPKDAANVIVDEGKNRNLTIDPESKGSTSILIRSKPPLDLSVNYLVGVSGLTNRTVYRQSTPGHVMDLMFSDKPIGVELDRERNVTTYRVFAPRAKWVELLLYDGPDRELYEPEFVKIEPSEQYRMWKDINDGVWEITLKGLDIGAYYMFRLDGPQGDGEGFSPYAIFGDLYARAASQAERNAVIIDPLATNKWFTGWTDQDYKQIKQEDAIIYETHVRHLTFHPSSKVSPELRGTYAGLLATTNTGTGLDHIKSIGANMVELMPLSEFNNSSNSYNWGYTTTFYFAPESSFGRDPENGSQYYEYKTLIDGMHAEGLGVIMDVVYNHYGWPNFPYMMDKKYFYRLNHDFTMSNFSACGNDIRTEAPMMRRMIVDNVLYWMDEFHVDGFRFDLAELIDMDTMKEIANAARAINPDVLLISEPWSDRGQNKHELTGLAWSAWNNDFRYAVKGFVQDEKNRDYLIQSIFGSLNSWAADPLQPVNYVESHDDMVLADELSGQPGHDGRTQTKQALERNLLAATILFTSLGIPMIGEGQEWLRSKQGLDNTFDAGDPVNELNYTQREQTYAKRAMNYYSGLMHLRSSPEGESFRLAERPENDYYQWIKPKNKSALGYVVNADHRYPGRAFIVLLNAADEKVTFTVPLGKGVWRMIGNGKVINQAGIPKQPIIKGSRTIPITLPAGRSVILMDGF